MTDPIFCYPTNQILEAKGSGVNRWLFCITTTVLGEQAQRWRARGVRRESDLAGSVLESRDIDAEASTHG